MMAGRYFAGSPAGISKLPMEMCDYIVDYLWDDRDALMACSGTCKMLLSASRYHIYYTVALATADRYESFNSLLDRTNYVAPHVRSLRFLEKRMSEKRSGEEEDQTPEFLQSGDWLRLLPMLTRLLHLSLRGFTLRIPAEVKGDLHLLLPRVRRLEYHAMQDEEEDIWTLACAVGSLSSLVVHSTPTILDEGSSIDVAKLESAIRSLRTLIWHPSTPATDKGTPLVLDIGDAPLGLRSLAIASIGSASSPTSFAQELMDASTETLEHLSLSFADPVVGRGGAHLDILRMRSLKTLHVTFSIQHTHAVITMLACIWCRELFPALTSLSMRVAISHKDFISTDEFGVDIARNWARLRFSLLLLICINTMLHATVIVDVRQLWFAPGVDINAATPEELKQCQALETQLIQNLLKSWDLPPAGTELGTLRYSFAWISAYSQAGLTSPADSESDFVRTPEWYYDIVSPSA